MTESPWLRTVRLLSRAQFLRFLVVGGINTLFSYGIFAGGLYLGFHYAAASLTSLVLGMFFSFVTHGRLVFKSTRASELPKFLGVALVMYFVHTGCLKIASVFEMNLYAAGAVLTGPLAVLAYLLNKKLVFRHGRDASAPGD